jgi:hypothetical protein
VDGAAIIAVQLDQVEGIAEDVLVGALVTHEIERGHAVVIASDRFAVDNAGARAQAGQCLDDQREAMGEVVAGTAVEPHLCALLAGDNPKTVVLDLMQPLAARRNASLTMRAFGAPVTRSFGRSTNRPGMCRAALT